MVWASQSFARSPATVGLISGSCSSARIFAPRFLQTPPRGGALALRYPSPPSGWDGTCTRKLSNMHGVQRKRRPRWPPPTFSDRLEPVQKPSIHSHVVLVGEAVKAEHHPVELHRAENQLAFSEVQAATEQHRHPAVANAGSRCMGAAK